MKIEIRKPTGDSSLADAFGAPFTVEEEAEFKKLMIVEDLLDLMKKQGIHRSELAKRMGVQPSRITSMLDGTNNFTIETLVRAARAVGATLEQTLVPIGMKGRWLAYYENEVHDGFKATIRPIGIRADAFHLESLIIAPNDPADAA